MSANKLKIVGEVFLVVPILILLSLGIGEVSRGIISGFQHFIQILPLLALVIFCWYKPKIGGGLLVGLASLLTIIYVLNFPLPLYARLINAAILLLPALVSGILFLMS